VPPGGVWFDDLEAVGPVRLGGPGSVGVDAGGSFAGPPDGFGSAAGVSDVDGLVGVVADSEVDGVSDLTRSGRPVGA